jgi:hypothetical protein
MALADPSGTAGRFPKKSGAGSHGHAAGRDYSPMSAAELPEAGRVLGAAFVSSPLEQAVRGTIDDRQRRGLVRAYTATCRLPGKVSVAWSADRIVGAIRWVESPRYQLQLGAAAIRYHQVTRPHCRVCCR